jgi:alanine-glyoxylate transaminase/serine-glyoxylate transaminase/serine-pyruvate transaminase
MDEIQSLLRYVWQTDNPHTIAVNGTGTAAMEATLANTVEPGDVVLIGVADYFRNRLVDMAQMWELLPNLGDRYFLYMELAQL